MGSKNLKVGSRVQCAHLDHPGWTGTVSEPLSKEWGKVWCWVNWDNHEPSGEMRRYLWRINETY